MAFRACYEPSCSRHLNTGVLRHFEDLFGSLEEGYMNGAQIHKENIVNYEKSITQLYSNTVCLYCLRRSPERHLSCGHSLCDTCVATLGTVVPGTETQVKVKCLFRDSGQSIVNLKPSTAGVRVMGIDGGGARGITPLGFMGELQKLLGTCEIHEMIDLATGTSSGRYPVYKRGQLY